jgi:hypothetical protein
MKELVQMVRCMFPHYLASERFRGSLKTKRFQGGSRSNCSVQRITNLQGHKQLLSRLECLKKSDQALARSLIARKTSTSSPRFGPSHLKTIIKPSQLFKNWKKTLRTLTMLLLQQQQFATNGEELSFLAEA